MNIDIWGFCAACERWFRCEGWFDRSVPHPTCKVCGAEPTAIENRTIALVGQPATS